MKVILFDMFGVIARHQSPESCARLETLSRVRGATFWEHYWAFRPPYDRGTKSGADYWQGMSTALGVSYSEQEIAELIAADLASWSDIDDEVVNFVIELADNGNKIGLLSNIPEELAAHYERHYEWLQRFTLVGFSCRIGYAKPDAGAYTWCSRKFGLPPEQILFIDDRAENVWAAEAVGMWGHQFTSLEELKAALPN